MADQGDYDIRMNDKYGQLRVIDIGAEAAAHEPWFNQTLTTVNDAVVRLGIFHGEFHFHKHDAEDELFMVLEGELLLDVEGQGTITLGPHQAYTVAKGITHRTRSPGRTVVLMIEAKGVQPTGD
jgi:mannose-6-phosphate isomerase-like protein (cupin superfamily)